VSLLCSSRDAEVRGKRVSGCRILSRDVCEGIGKGIAGPFKGSCLDAVVCGKKWPGMRKGDIWIYTWNTGLMFYSDIHIYHFQNNPFQVQFAKELWERIRRECAYLLPLSRLHLFFPSSPPPAPKLTPTVPELRIYRFWEYPVGPHPIAMFEVNIFTPAQFGAFIPWLCINRGPLSVLVHPNTVEVVEDQESGEKREVRDEERDHTQRAIWMGERIALDLSLFKRRKAEKEEPKKE